MRFQTDSGSFGIRLTKVAGRRLSTVQLLFDDRAYGAEEDGSSNWSMLQSLTEVKTTDDPRLNPKSAAPSELLRSILTDDKLYDLCLVQLGEGFDGYVKRIYRWRDEVVFLWANGDLYSEHVDTPVDIEIVPAGDYSQVIDLAIRYHDQIFPSPA